MLDLSRYIRPGDGVWWGPGGAEPEPLPATLTLLSYGGLGLLRTLSRRGGARKAIDQGLAITGAALGSAALYGRLPGFPVEFRAASYTHDPVALSRLRSLVSVNSAIEVDLLGQVGGQADFSRAAALAGARSVSALRSESGGRSAITAVLPGGVVTTARSDVDAVVTEHGVAALAGCTIAERARRLVAIAAPHHREQLESSLARQPIPA